MAGVGFISLPLERLSGGHYSFPHFMSIPHLATFVRRSLYEKNVFFDDSFKIAGDWELILRFFKDGETFVRPTVC